ncbi:MAG: aromatic amino acid lyase [Desulfobacteraceae bacterium]
MDSIPTSANKEDHVSMGTIAARKCREIVANAEHVVAHRTALRRPGPEPVHPSQTRPWQHGRLRNHPPAHLPSVCGPHPGRRHRRHERADALPAPSWTRWSSAPAGCGGVSDVPGARLPIKERHI